MGAAAGANVDPRDGDDPHRAAELLLAAVIEVLQLVRLWPGGGDGQVPPDGLVRFKFDFAEELFPDLPVEVQGHLPLPEMEADVSQPQPAVDEDVYKRQP